jgi:hypothetical protein
VILINSAKFVVSDLQSEFGKIPSAFLPLGNKRVYEIQVEILRSFFPQENIWLSLPEEFILSNFDLESLNSLKVNVIKHPKSYTLSQSVSKSIKFIGTQDNSIRILHGDTLLFDLPKSTDTLIVSKPASQQDWFFDDKDELLVWAGYFSFSNSRALRDALELGGGLGFEQSILEYEKSHPMLRIATQDWLDIGHVSSYYLARAEKLVNRYFNKIDYHDGLLKKTGPLKKIQGEIYWYCNLPPNLRVISPQLITEANLNDNNYYFMEYLPLPTLSEIFVFGANSNHFWSNIFRLLGNYLGMCKTSIESVRIEISDPEDSINLVEDFRKLVIERLQTFENENNYFSRNKEVSVNGSPPCSIESIIKVCFENISVPIVPIGVIHGDLCLGNVLFDVRANRIRIIDPRGLDFNDRNSMLGDTRYDLAKLAHSFLGYYDYIIAERFFLSDNSNAVHLDFDFEIYVEESKNIISTNFYHHFLKNHEYKNACISYMILLFITMIPLHSEDKNRQKAFLANSVMLFNKYLRSEN